MKKKWFVLIFSFIFLVLNISLCFGGDVYVKGYYKNNRTDVKPHYRTSPDSSKSNNYSTKGNLNPHTGQKGYTDPYN